MSTWIRLELIPGVVMVQAKWKPLIYNFRHYFGLGQLVGKTFRAEV